ncbi:MAG: glutamine--tRNA ligase/YqeY domain fusion protein [Verrucomicrobia bacterium]|nr:glutamine--tRNA ligase/YqeY domain fusion protein [Verrucomicrobiota bacterium]MBU1733710.1 glutamine--tRNA ligase/YqeY domain fusion protein [Verrucomicrobiota bacterium]MBU1856556.1 glutamine--tRNA ligase/YqeY domain fusion protein [Verrucomicrobiota bacterium]
MTTPDDSTSRHFVREIIENDIKAGKHGGKVVTRFPPEPNGYLHIGHAKSICMNFGLAADFGGRCHLRFDDTNPETEDVEYVESIQQDIRWLGFDWDKHLHYASDYYEQLYQFAIQLIQAGKAYVCALSSEEFKTCRGVPTAPGKESPWRNRAIAENLDLFKRMRAGEFAEGQYVLRAKIDMTSPNLHLRDPVIYRINKTPHHRTGAQWPIYPMYDFAHCLSDSIEGITHSICTLEFEVHRPLYDWILDQLKAPCHPQQIEFARLNLTYTVMSKRKLQELVVAKVVSGWDDPRMPTLAGMRRRGYTSEGIREFCHRVGVTKVNSLSDFALLEHCIRDNLNKSALRVMGVLNPLRVVIDNYPEGQEETFTAQNNPEDPRTANAAGAGTRQIPFSRELFIEREDFMEDPPKKFFRLAPGREVRLRNACFIKCVHVVKDPATGKIVELHCTYDPLTRGGNAPDGRKVKATLHWVSAAHALEAEVRLYDRLFTKENPADESDGTDFKKHLNPDSLKTITACVEPSLKNAQPGSRYQFERIGYFCVDPGSTEAKLIFNRTITLQDIWTKIQAAATKKIDGR